jgi:XTP/dITP diphosphohydrolase
LKIRELKLATSNPGKLREYLRLAPNSPVALQWMSGFAEITPFDESAPTFAENGAGKAIYYSRFCAGVVLAEDSGLVVPALGGAPGVRSARYGGENASDEDRVRLVLQQMKGKSGQERAARFTCVTALAYAGSPLLIVSDFVEGVLTEEPRGTGGFGYDPIFFATELGRTTAEATGEDKDRISHRGKAFRKLIQMISEGDFSGLRAPAAAHSGKAPMV